MNDIRIYYRDVRRNESRSDITDIVESATISTSINAGAGKCELSIVGDGASFNFGSCVNVYSGENEVFRGYLFSVSMRDDERFNATFYDQTRYLRNADCIVYKNITVSQLFKDICDKYDLETGTIDESEYLLPPTVAEGRSLWDMLQEGISAESAYKKRQFVIRDNAGALEFRDIENLRTDFIIDDEGVAMGFDFTRGIDKRTYNRIKIGFENDKQQAREWEILDNSEYIGEWGVLQFYSLLKERIDRNDLKERCRQQLALLCWPTTDARISCLGDFRISSGSGVMLNLKKIQAFNGMSGFYVTSCEHHISSDIHTMDLTLAVDNFGG